MARVLIVEDNALNRDLLERMLDRRGYQVIAAVNGEEGVRTARAALPDVVLMDLRMPVLDGWAATRRLKADSATRSLPVIAITAHALDGDRDQAMAAGCDDYEVKPVDLERLVGKIERLLSSRHVA